MLENKKILVVDDEEHLRALIKDILENEGFKVTACADTESAYKKILNSKPDLILLDVDIPKIGGFELCKKIRENIQMQDLPIIMLTVKSQESDKVLGLNLGADDYITKPFSNRELVARIASVFRRIKAKKTAHKIKSGELVMDLDSKSIFLNGKEIYLRHKEFDLLYMFLLHPNEALNKEFILENVFEYNSSAQTRTINTHLKNLRQALGKWGKKHIETISKVGFKFVPNIKTR
jgi:two-component system alkaline phosphatase synthesis response regulator PhoP